MILRPGRFRTAARASAAASILCGWAGLLVHCGTPGSTTPAGEESSTRGEESSTRGSTGASSQGSSTGTHSGAPSSSSVATTGSSSTIATTRTSSESASDAGGAPDATGGGSDASGGSDGSAATYAPCPTDGGVCAILPLGDSITFGICNGGTTGCPGGYRVELFTDAVNDHKNITFVGDPSLANGPMTVAGVTFPRNNVGHSGWTIAQIDGLLPGALKWSSQPTPNVVLLHIGTNDFDGVGSASLESTAPTRLGMLVDDIIKGLPDALVVVAQIVPYPGNASGIATYNAAIPALIQARAAAGKHVIIVDMHSGFVVSTMLGADNVHPNLKGYAFMGDTWYAAIKSVLP